MEWERQRVYDYDNGKEAGRAEGLMAGEKKRAISDAINLLKMNVLTPEQIAQATGLTQDEVLALAKEASA